MNQQVKKNINSPDFAFWGTPDVASETLAILIENGYIPKVVITNPDRPRGRGLHLLPSPVKVLAEKHNIPVLTPEKVDAEFTSLLSTYNLLLNIVVAYGKILPEEVINMPKFGTLNIHYSLLPKYRGASPLESALLNGESETGVSIQKMVYKMDAGDIVAEEKVPISIHIDKVYLREVLIHRGAKLLVEIIPSYIEGKIELKKQDESRATNCKKIKKEDGEIKLDGSSTENYNKYRAYAGWPGVYFFKDGKRIKITRARFEDNSFIIERIIPEGKKEIDFNILK